MEFAPSELDIVFFRAFASVYAMSIGALWIQFRNSVNRVIEIVRTV